MFLDQKLKNIQKRKAGLAICCDLRRRLIHIEVRGFFGGVRNTFANLTVGVAIVKEILSYWHEHKTRR